MRERRALVIRAVLARARDRELDEHRRDGQQDDPEDHADHAELARVTVVAIAAAEPERPLGELREVGDRASDGRDDGHDERVAVLHVTEFVREDRGELSLVGDLGDAACHRDDGVLRIAARREGVRRRLVDNVDARLRHIRDLRDVTDDAVQLRRLLWRDRLRARERQRDAVAEPPGAEVHEERDAERERYGGLSEEEPRAEDEQEREDREETNGLDRVHASDSRTAFMNEM